MEAAIYHFTNKSERRPKIYREQLKALEEYALSLGFEVTDIYFDTSLKRFERVEYERFLECCEKYDALITKDFYHISKNTGQFVSDVKMMKGIRVYSMENGSFVLDEAPFHEPLRIATYTSNNGELENDIFRHFVKKKTKWTIEGQFFDVRSIKGKYDLLLVHNLNDVHCRTSHFCKIKERLGMGIYSLQEGIFI